jgi:hypothetical protein
MEYGYGIWHPAVSRELSKYKLDLVGLQEVRLEDGGTEPAGEYTFFYGKRLKLLLQSLKSINRQVVIKFWQNCFRQMVKHYFLRSKNLIIPLE